MAASLLRRLAVPGAWLAAAIFALHPVQVESVAWITELKNTLSAVFYLGAAIAYLRFDQTRKIRWYLRRLGPFAFGLLSKTVVATLPAALLVDLLVAERAASVGDTTSGPCFRSFSLVLGPACYGLGRADASSAPRAQFDLSAVQRA